MDSFIQSNSFNSLNTIKTMIILVLGLVFVILCIDMGDQFVNNISDDDSLESLIELHDYYYPQRNLRMSNETQSEDELNKHYYPGYENSEMDLSKILEHEQEINEISLFYSDVSDKLYKGNWTSEIPVDNFDNQFTGEFDLRIIKLQNQHRIHLDESRSVLILFRMLDGEYLDRWIFSNTYGLYLTKASFKNNTYRASFVSKIDKMEIFQKTQPTSSCTSEFVFNIQRNETNSEIIETISGTFYSEACAFKIYFNTVLHNTHHESSKFFYYSLFISLLAAFQIFNNIMMNSKIAEAPANSNSISLLTIGQNIIWNAYGCLCHFFLTVNFENYTFHFAIPALLFFTNFSIFELKLMYNLWKNHNAQHAYDAVIMRRKLIQFYFTFYIAMFISLFFVMKFYFDKFYIVIGILFTWLPQIVYNSLYNNKLSMPLFHVIITSVNKMFLPFYFRGCPENFFQLSTDYNLIIVCIVLMILEIVFMYSQSMFGSRWFLPESLRPDTYNYYKTKEEVLDIYPNADNLECVICLFHLFQDNLKTLDYEDFIEIGPQRSTLSLKLWKRMQKLYIYMFEFNEVTGSEKPYMMTPCKHFFHTHCLKTWFKQKKECPNCRRSIEDISSI